MLSPKILSETLPYFASHAVSAVRPTLLAAPLPASKTSKATLEQTFWHTAGAFVLRKEVVQATAAAATAGGFTDRTRCTALYRTRVLQDAGFLEGFVNETFAGQRLKSGDEAYLSRQAAAHGRIVWAPGRDTTVRTEVSMSGEETVPQWIRWARVEARRNVVAWREERDWAALRRLCRPCVWFAELLLLVWAVSTSGACSQGGFAVGIWMVGVLAEVLPVVLLSRKCFEYNEPGALLLLADLAVAVAAEWVQKLARLIGLLTLKESGWIGRSRARAGG